MLQGFSTNQNSQTKRSQAGFREFPGRNEMRFVFLVFEASTLKPFTTYKSLSDTIFHQFFIIGIWSTGLRSDRLRDVNLVTLVQDRCSSFNAGIKGRAIRKVRENSHNFRTSHRFISPNAFCYILTAAMSHGLKVSAAPVSVSQGRTRPCKTEQQCSE